MKLIPENPPEKNAAAILAIGLLILLAYSNSFQADWHMDDFPNILQNPAVQIPDLSLESLQRAIGIDRAQGNNLPRPVTNLTFALNWWTHGDNVAGYHLVNIAVHLINAWLLFLIVVRLGALPVFADIERRHRTFIALFTALLWALNPIQTQAVTYVVQRYTSLTTLFFLGATYSYLHGRMNPKFWPAVLWWGLALGCYLIALGSKENAAIWPASVLLMEWTFFRNNYGHRSVHFPKIALAATIITVVFVGGLLIIFKINIVNAILNGFDGRPFSLAERLMTQPRVLIFYISQIFYPIPQRLSLEHDFTVSNGLLDPATTLPAMVAVGLMITAALISVRKQPLLAFATLFFFLNHVVESSILPLEMVFEHRNYLPSLFIFWPLVAGGIRMHELLERRQSPLRRMLPVVAVGVLFLLLIGTFTRNLDWQTERSLWVDTYHKAPQSARAAVNLANDLARAEKHDPAENLYLKAMDLNSPKKNQFKVVARSNLATMYFNTGQYAKSIEQWRQVLSLASFNRPARQGLARSYIATGAFDKAEEQIDWMIKRHPQAVYFLNVKGFLLIRKNRPEEALNVLRRALAENPAHRDTLIRIGVAHAMLANHDRADWFFRRAGRLAARDPLVQLLRLENRLEAGPDKDTEVLIEKILGRYPLEMIRTRLKDPAGEIRHPKRLWRVLLQHIELKVHQIENMDITS